MIKKPHRGDIMVAASRRIGKKEPRGGDIITILIMPPLRGSEKYFARTLVKCRRCAAFKTLFGLTWPNLNFARQRPRVHFQEVYHHLSEVFRLDFPVIGRVWLVVVKMCGYGAGHDRGTFNPCFAQVEHDGLGEAHDAKFAGIVRRSGGEKIGARKT